MKIEMNGTILLSGNVSDITFSPAKDKVKIEFKDEGNFVFEFNDKKKKRAQHVLKSRMKKGETLLAIGAQSEGSHMYGYGFEVMREGKITQDGCTIIRGTISDVVKAGKKLIVRVSYKNKTVSILCGSSFSDKLVVGEKRTFLCCEINTVYCEENKCPNAWLGCTATCQKALKITRLHCQMVE